MIRDQALFVSGLLIEKLGGPSVKPYVADGRDQTTSPTPGTSDRLYRRSLYTYWKRASAPPYMLTFDAAHRESCIVRETRTNTPLQALNLMNDVTFVEAARLLAERMLKEGGQTEAARLIYGFRLVATRRPDADELQTLRRSLRAQLAYFQADPAGAVSFLHAGEKPSDNKLNKSELAAYAAVASLLLNLDEVVTKE